MAYRKGAGNYLSVLLVGAALLLGTILAQAAEEKTWEGTVSNTHCGLKHSSPDVNAKGCVNTCVNKRGASYALVVGDKVYVLDGATAELRALAGLKAKVTGTVDGMKIKVSSVSSAS